MVEALRAGVPATALYVAGGLASDERVTEAVSEAGERGIALLEVSRPELDRLTGNAIHQGLALVVPPYQYAHPEDLLARAKDSGRAAADRRGRRRHRPAEPRAPSSGRPPRSARTAWWCRSGAAPA